MRKCSRIRNACMCTCMECQREMGGGGGHLVGAPTNWKDGLWGQWWAKLPRVLEWQGRTGGVKSTAQWLGKGGGALNVEEQCWGEVGGGGGAPIQVAASPKKWLPWRGVSGGQPC